MISCRFHQANKISNVPMYTLTLPICSHQTSFLKLTANKVSLLQEMTIPFLKIIMLPSLSQNLNLELEFATWKKWKLQKNIGIRKNRCSNRKFFNYTVSIQISTSCDMTYNNSSMFICQTRKKKHIQQKRQEDIQTSTRYICLYFFHRTVSIHPSNQPNVPDKCIEN